MADIRSFFGAPKIKSSTVGSAAAAGSKPASKTPGKAAAASSSKAKESAAKPQAAAASSAAKAADSKKSSSAQKPVVMDVDSDDEVSVVLVVDSPTPSKASASTAAATSTASPAAKASTPASATRKRKARKVIIESDDDDDDAAEGDTYEPEDNGSDDEAGEGSDFEPEVVESSSSSKASAKKVSSSSSSSKAKSPGSATKKAKKEASTTAKKATPVKAEKGSASKASTAKKAKAAAVEITGSNQKYKHSWVKGASPLKPEESWRSLDMPEGADGCLEGAAFAITGQLDSLSRDAAEDMIKEYGGKVTTAVSGKTTYLLYGDVLEDGRPVTDSKKYRTAVEKGTTLIKEQQLLQIIADSKPQIVKSEADTATAAGGESPVVYQRSGTLAGATAAVAAAAAAAASTAAAAAPAAAAADSKPAVVNPYAKKAVVNPYAKSGSSSANPYAKKPAAAAAVAVKTAVVSPKKAVASISSSSSSAINGKQQQPEILNQMWADKHKPTCVEDIIGHTGEVKKLTQWLTEWNSIHRVSTATAAAAEDDYDNSDEETVKPKAKGKGKAKPAAAKLNIKEKACLISGPPGIGKTTAAHIVAQSLGLHITEFNASDVRSKLSLESEVKTVLGNSVLSFDAPKKGSAVKPQGRVIIMDEVDGMGAGDRGGMAELILLIKKSKVPIICICNDRQSTKVKSLAGYCLDLKFRRPMKSMVAKRMMAVAQAEGLTVDGNAAETLCESVGNDIRQVLHAMEMWSRRSSTMKYKEVKGGLNNMEKDKGLGMNPFDACKIIVCGAKTSSLADRREAFFSDYSLMPLMVQDSWVTALAASKDKDTQMARMVKAAEACSDADLVGAMVRGDVQHWELLTTYASLNVRVGVAIEDGYFGFAGFPPWLGQNSKTTKRKRLIAELMTHMNARVTGDRNAIRLNYMPVLARTLTAPLRASGVEGVPAATALLDEYGLSRDDLFESLGDFTFTNMPNYIGGIDTKCKTAFTREYNASGHTSQALVEPLAAVKKGKAKKRIPKSLDMSGKAPDDNRDYDDDVINDDVVDDVAEDSDEDYSALAKKPKGKGAAAKGKAAAKTAAKTKPTVTKARAKK